MLDFSNGIDMVTDNLTHWGRVTHICIGKLTILGSDNGLLPGWRQAIIWTNAVFLSTGPLRTYFSEYLSKNTTIFIEENAHESVACEMASILSRPQCVKQKWLQTNHWVCYMGHDSSVAWLVNKTERWCRRITVMNVTFPRLIKSDSWQIMDSKGYYW